MDQTKEIRHVSTSREPALRGTLSQHATLWLPAIETIIGAALIVAAGLMMPGSGWGLLNVNPHPLWIICAAIAARYGGRAGYFAGAVAGLTYSALIVTRPGGSIAQIDAIVFLQPLLMLITGAALGEMTDARERRLARLEERTRGLGAALDRLWQRYRTVNNVNDVLNMRIAFGPNPDSLPRSAEQHRDSRRILESVPARPWASPPDEPSRRSKRP